MVTHQIYAWNIQVKHILCYQATTQARKHYSFYFSGSLVPGTQSFQKSIWYAFFRKAETGTEKSLGGSRGEETNHEHIIGALRKNGGGLSLDNCICHLPLSL